MLSSLRGMVLLGRNAGAVGEFSNAVSEAAGTSIRAFAAGAKTSLGDYVSGIRAQIATAYEDRANKYEAYIAKFEELVATEGIPRATDFASVQAFAKKRASILKSVGFPDDWKVSSAAADEIKAILKRIPEEKKKTEPADDAAWYLSLSADQISQCAKDPQLFVELEKLHKFEEQFAAASRSQATKFDLPPVDIGDLPSMLDPVTDDCHISAKEVKWIVQKAKEQAAALRKNDPRFSDPYSTPEFKALQEANAERFGITKEMLADLQKEMTPAKWKAEAAARGISIAP